MADIQKGELQDNLGNTIYPQTSSDIVFCEDGKSAQEKFADHDEKLTTQSSKLTAHDSILNTHTSDIAAANTNMGKIRTYVGSDGKLHFVDASGADSVLPFSKATIVSQTVSGSTTLGLNSYGNVVLNFNQLSGISGVSAISISDPDGRNVTRGMRIGGNQIVFDCFHANGGTVTVTYTVTAFQIIN